MVALTKHVIPGLHLHARDPWHLEDFRNIFLLNISEGQKKSYRALSSGAVSYGKYGADYCVTFIKSLDEA